MDANVGPPGIRDGLARDGAHQSCPQGPGEVHARLPGRTGQRAGRGRRQAGDDRLGDRSAVDQTEGRDADPRIGDSGRGCRDRRDPVGRDDRRGREGETDVAPGADRALRAERQCLSHVLGGGSLVREHDRGSAGGPEQRSGRPGAGHDPHPDHRRGVAGAHRGVQRAARLRALTAGLLPRRHAAARRNRRPGDRDVWGQSDQVHPR